MPTEFQRTGACTTSEYSLMRCLIYTRGAYMYVAYCVPRVVVYDQFSRCVDVPDNTYGQTSRAARYFVHAGYVTLRSECPPGGYYALNNDALPDWAVTMLAQVQLGELGE